MPRIAPVSESIDKNFRADPTKTPEQNKQAIKDLYQLDMSRSEVRDLLEEVVDHPDRFMRASAERDEARRLSEQMRDVIADEIVTRPLFNKEMTQKYPGATGLERCTVFYRRDGGAGAQQFNEDLAAAETRKDPKAVAELMLKEVTRVLDQFGIQGPQDLMKLYNLTDRQLVEGYSDLRRLPNMLTEMIDGDAIRYGKLLSQEQQDYLKEMKAVQDLFAMVIFRADMIANPLYADYDYTRMLGQGISSQKLDEHLEESLGDYSAAANHPVTAFLKQNEVLHQFTANGIVDRVEALEPALKGAVYHDDPGVSLMSNKPLVATGTDGKQYVINNAVFMDKVPTVEEYTQQLSQRAAKADRFLLTGSRQFSTMQKAMEDLRRIKEHGGSTQEVKTYAEKLEAAAKEYLKHKGVKYDQVEGHASLHGKNKREQSRLEVGFDYLEYARAQTKMQTKVAEIKSQQKPTEKKPVERKARTLVQNELDVVSADGKQKFVEFLPDMFVNLFARNVPMMQTEENGPSKIVMSQEEFSALCALASASPKAHYTHSVKGTGGKATVMNDNPEETYKGMLAATLGGQNMGTLPKGLANMLTGTTSVTFHAVRRGNFEELGQMLADGLKMNSKLMQEQPRFTPEFYACAKLTANLLNLMDKNPELQGLKAVVEKRLTPEEMQTARSCKGVYDVIADGIHAQKMLGSRFAMPDHAKGFSRNDGPGDRGILDDMAKLCHMYGLEKQFATGNLKLDSCNYGKYPDFAKQTNDRLAGDKSIGEFVDKLEKMELEDRFNAIKQPKEMANLCQNSLSNIKEAVQQQNQPQAQVQQQKQMEQAAANKGFGL